MFTLEIKVRIVLRMFVRSLKNSFKVPRMLSMNDSCNQQNQKGERIENFVKELKRLLLHCEFGYFQDSLIRDCIVSGVLWGELRRELLKKPNLILESVHDYCRTHIRKTEISFWQAIYWRWARHIQYPNYI